MPPDPIVKPVDYRGIAKSVYRAGNQTLRLLPGRHPLPDHSGSNL